MKDTEAIALPPLRPPEKRRGGVPVWLWAVVLPLVLLLGFASGWWLQRDVDEGKGGEGAAGVPMVSEGEVNDGEVPITTAAVVKSPQAVALEEIPGLLAEARLAMADEDWAGAQRRYDKVLVIDPANSEARLTLPKIADRLEAQRGDLLVTTQPAGAMVALAGEEMATDEDGVAKFENVSAGRHVVEVKLEGFEPLNQEVVVEKGRLVKIEPLVLVKSKGALKVSSQPPGVNYVIRRLDEDSAMAATAVPESQVVARGTTPADLADLVVGRYEISMTQPGWPVHTEAVTVRSHRETSVSHVFARGGLQLTSDPSGAEVWMRSIDDSVTADPRKGELLGKTPLSLTDIPSGGHRLVLLYDDWAPIQRTVEVVAGEELKLEFAWKRGLVNFVSDPPGAEIFLRGERVGTLEDRTPFQWEFPEGDYPFQAQLPGSDLNGVSVDWPVRADVENRAEFVFGYGSVSIRTEPPGVAVYANGKPVGATPFVQPLAKPGQYSYTLRKQNYTATSVSGEVVPGQELSFNVKMKFDPNPEPGRDFTNGVGMEMKWIEGLRGWVGVHEVTQMAYQTVMSENPSLFRAPDKPVDSVSWKDAEKFTTRLTAVEHGRRKLPDRFQYRLPNDEEWSYFAGDANLVDAVTSKGQRRSTSEPVGSSKPNQFGLYDVRGNVWEWCEDWYSTSILNRMGKAELVGNPSLAATEHKFVRGGSWSGSQEYELATGWRSPLKPSSSEKADVGFRVVLMPGN